MEQNHNNHPGALVFDALLREFRGTVRGEIATLREELMSELKNIHYSSASKHDAPRFYRIKQAAAELNVSQLTVRRLIKRGLSKVNYATRHLLIPREQIESFVKSNLR